MYCKLKWDKDSKIKNFLMILYFYFAVETALTVLAIQYNSFVLISFFSSK